MNISLKASNSALRFGRLTFLISSFIISAFSQVNVLSHAYGTSNLSANLNETQLNQSNVNTSTFGKLGKYSVDGVIYAMPLYVQGVTINGASHNVLYVATMHDVLYAFDADNVGSLPLWTLDFRNLAMGIAPPAIHPTVGDGTDGSVADTFGIMSTPVIDLPNNRLFCITHTNENGTEYFRLRSVDIRTGALLNSVAISGSVPALGSAPGVTFVPNHYAQRGALQLADGQVWFPFGSRPTGDYTPPWYGWIFTYNPNTLAQTGVFATSRTNGNSIFQAGAAPAVDSNGNVWYLSANGGIYDPATEWPMSLLKMSFTNGTLGLSDWYTPDAGGSENYNTLDIYDLDMSTNAPILIPGTDLVTFGSKTGDVYLLHTGNLGELQAGDPQIAQFMHVGAPVQYENDDSDRIVGMVFWPRSGGGTLFVWPAQDTLHAFSLNPTTAQYTQIFAGSTYLVGQPGSRVVLSANGTTTGTGILWAPIMNTQVEINSVGQAATLHAYNADNPGQELWNSSMVSSDSMGTLAKFVPPLVANGKVYIANSAVIGDYGSGSVTVYGLKSAASGHVNPYATVTAPINGSTFVSGTPITVSASCYPSTGNSLTSVTLMDGTTVLATLTAAPYTFNWTNAAIGIHTITAIATDQTGAVTTSIASTITVTGSPLITLSASPASLTVPMGGSATALITVTPQNGYSGGASFTTIGIPSGVTSSYSAGANANTFTLTLSASTSATLGSTTLIIDAGANGGVASSLVLPLTVAPSPALKVGSNLVSLTVPSGVTLGTPVVFTEGVPSSSLASADFTLLSNGTTCTGAPSGTTCAVNVQFTPQFAGLRRGAIKIFDTNNNLLLTSFIYGVGSPSNPVWTAVTPKTLYNTGAPRGVAVDGAGDVFVVDSSLNQVLKIVPGGTPTAVPLGFTLSSPYGVTLDGAGNLYVSDAGNNRILKLAYGASSATVLSLSGLVNPEGMAVDGSGDLFIANANGAAAGASSLGGNGNGSGTAGGNGNIVEVAAGTGIQTTVVDSGLGYPSGVAVDGSNNLFIADWLNNRVLEIPSGSVLLLHGTYSGQVSIGSNLSEASSVAVDGYGNVFITDQNHGQVVEVLGTANGPGTGVQVTLTTGLVTPYAMALDGQGDVFVANVGNAATSGSVIEIPRPGTQTISFGSIATQAVATSITLTATATSGLTVSFASSTPAVCSVSGTTATMIGAGTCSIVASQAGNTTYSAAATVTQSFLVAGAPQTITFGAIATQTVNSSIVLSGTATSGLPLTYSSGTPGVCSVSGSTATAISAGVCSITAAQAGSNVYSAAASVTQTFTVAQDLANFGQPQKLSATFTVPSGVTLGTPIVFTEGVPSNSLTNPDFTLNSTGTTCTGAATGTCAVSVQFLPQRAGLRRGAVKLVDNNNNVLATAFISGTGVSSQQAFAAGTATTIYKQGSVKGTAVDGAGNVFVVDSAANQLYKVAPGGKPVAVTLGVTMSTPFGVALDAAGNIYIADAGNNRVLELPYGSSTAAAVNVTGLNFPEGVAVDGGGNLFIANTRGTATSGNGTIIELAAGSGTQSTVAGTGLSYPSGVALDAAGDVFIADWGNSRVLEIPAGGGSSLSIGSNLSLASAVAVDAAGDVFIADQNHGQVVEVPGTSSGPGTGTQVTIATGLITPYGLALDGQGDVFVVSVGNATTSGSVIEIPRLIAVTFTVPAGVTLGTPVVFTEGVPSSSLVNPDFTLVFNGTTCNAAVTTSTCTVNVQFTPQYAGLRRGAVKLVDSNNNVLATSFIYGTGAGTQTSWTAGTSKTIYKAGSVRGVAVDGAGDVFFVDTVANQVFKLAPAGVPVALTLGLTLNSPFGLALDAAGNLYIADAGNNRVVELPFGSTTAVALNISGLTFPEGVAVDGGGNLFVANTRGSAASGNGTIVKLAAATGTQTTLVSTGLGYPSGVAVDAAGDLFIADWGNNRALEITAGGAQVSIGSNIALASAVAVDALGDVFIADQTHNQLVEVAGTASGAGTGTQTTIATGLITPYGLALDGQGDVFIANIGGSGNSGSVLEVTRAGSAVAQPQTIAFGAIATQTLGASVTLSATASSGLAVSFASATPATCSVAGSTATLLASGTCTIVASQPGSSTYTAAIPVAQSFSIVGSGQSTGVTFTVPSGVTLGTPIVFTEGVPSSSLSSPDFTLLTSTCSGSVSGTCTVSVQFKPQQAGLRRGAVKLVDSNNNVLATSFISGIGPNSLPAWTAGTTKTIYTGFPRGVTVDGAGNVYFVDTSANQVYKSTGGASPAALNLGVTLNSPFGLALDGAGNLYIADAGNNRVLQLPYGSSTATALNVTGLSFPEGVAADGAGNIFIANTRGTATTGNGSVIKLAAGTGVQTTVVGSGLSFPSGLAVDASGDLFIADWGNNRVLELSVTGSALAIGSNLANASAVAVDAAGDVFITDQTHNQLVEVPGTAGGPGTGTQTTVATGLVTPYGLALDGQGDVFVVNVGNATTNGSVIEILRAGVTVQTQTITFGAIGTQTMGTPLTLSASASSGLTVSYVSSTTGVCTVSGNTATFVASGVCTIVASQAGSSAYTAASSVVQSFTVLAAGQITAVTFNVASGVTLGTPVVFTEGVPSSSLTNPDFALSAAGTTCTSGVTGTCTVNVLFSPQQSGLRRGAVKLVDSNNNVLATSYISGVGPAMKTAWTAATTKTVYAPVKGYPRGVTVDGAGNVYVVDTQTSQVYKITPGGTTTTLTLGTTLNAPFGLALDGAGNLYIADAGNNRILQLPYGGSTASALNITGLNYPEALAVDGSGNLFIANTRGTATTGNGTVLKLGLISGTQSTILASGLNFPSGVAVDASGDIFVADWGNNRVVELAVTGATLSIGSGLANASAVAVDAAGDVFIADQNHNQLLEVPATSAGPGTGSQITVATGLATPYGLAIDGQGDLFVANLGGGATIGSVIEIPN